MSTLREAFARAIGGTRRRPPSRRRSHAFRPDSIERFEVRVVPAVVVPNNLPDIYVGGLVELVGGIQYGPGTASVTIQLTAAGLAAGNPVQVGLASYTHAKDPTLGPTWDPGLADQVLFDFDHATLNAAHPSVTLTVKIGCSPTGLAQVDAFVGQKISKFDQSPSDSYDDRILAGEVIPTDCTVPGPTPGPVPKVKGNNGIGNGVDPPPPGNPRPNDVIDPGSTQGGHPGSPGWH